MSAPGPDLGHHAGVLLPGTLAGVLVLVLLVSAVLGPRMVRAAAPALVRAPRAAVALLLGGAILWIGVALAVGPLLAWVVTGPGILPEPATRVCQACVQAANPFLAGQIDAGVPGVLLIAPSALAGALLVGAVVRDVRTRSRVSGAVAGQVLAAGARRRVLGHDVVVVDDDRPLAMALPARHGGIILSTGTLGLLGRDELRAVLAHETAHLRQRHHVLGAVASSLGRRLHRVPLVAAAASAVPVYLEIAADDAARRRTGTVALVGALARLGEGVVPTLAGEPGAVLHAAGPERIRHLVHPARGWAGLLPVVGVLLTLTALSTLGASVGLPYAAALLHGC